MAKKIRYMGKVYDADDFSDEEVRHYDQEESKRDPARQTDLLDEIEIHLRYGLPKLILIGWIIIGLLVVILFNIK
jgi:hypothetical protein